MSRREKTPFQFILILALMCVAGVMVNALFPVGIAAGLLYVPAILISLSLPQRQHTVVVAIVCSTLVVLDHLFLPSDASAWVVLAERTVALIVIWITALLALKGNAVSERINRAQSADSTSSQLSWLPRLMGRTGVVIAKLPGPNDPLNVDDPSGRGITLMQTFMDEVAYNDAGNIVTLTKRQTRNHADEITAELG